jgi:hypothetical protein
MITSLDGEAECGAEVIEVVRPAEVVLIDDLPHGAVELREERRVPLGCQRLIIARAGLTRFICECAHGTAQSPCPKECSPPRGASKPF